jgi:hypothetical protein
MKTSLGADVIQSFDAVVAYYIKRICKMLNPQLNIATIFDAFVFSQHLDVNTFKNISRLACQLAMKQNFVKDMVSANNLIYNEFYQTFDKNIFDPLKDNVLSKVIESNLIFYLLKNQPKWFTQIVTPKPHNYFNKKFFIDSFQYLNSDEKSRYDLYTKNLVEEHKSHTINIYAIVYGKETANKNTREIIKELENSHKIKFILKELKASLKILHENFYVRDNKTVMFALRQIMNYDDFMK